MIYLQVNVRSRLILGVVGVLLLEYERLNGEFGVIEHGIADENDGDAVGIWGDEV